MKRSAINPTPSYAGATHGSTNLVFSASHAARFRMAADLLGLQRAERFLDYGCGDGHLLAMLVPTGAELFGYDPAPEMKAALQALDSVTAIERVAALPSGSFDAASCCEVLEHVTSAEGAAIMEACHRILRPDGRMVVSVPVEIGPAAVAKHVLRRIGGRPAEANATWSNLARAAVGMKVQRLDYGGGYFGHVGFDFRLLPALFERTGFKILRQAFSPFPALGPLCNSQTFFLLQRG